MTEQQAQQLTTERIARALGLAQAIAQARPYPVEMDGVRDVAAEIVRLLDAALGAVAASPDEGPKDDAKCRCGHTAHWHAAVVYDGPGEPETVPQGAGGCEERSEDGSPCGCVRFDAVAGPADEGLRAALRGILDLHDRAERGELHSDEVDETINTARAALDAAAGCLPEDENQARITVKAVYEFGTHGERRWTLVEAPRPTPEQALAETELSFPVPRLRVGDKDPT